MLPTKEQLVAMPLKVLADRLHGCSPGSEMWNVVWAAYETKRYKSEIRRTWIFFAISTAIALAALTRTFFPAPPSHTDGAKPAAVLKQCFLFQAKKTSLSESAYNGLERRR
jgi:hypothetical protein